MYILGGTVQALEPVQGGLTLDKPLWVPAQNLWREWPIVRYFTGMRYVPPAHNSIHQNLLR